jgi:hypothetical protein
MVGGTKLNLVSMDQMTNEHIVTVGWLEQLQWTYGEARQDGPLLNHICGMLAGYKDVLADRLLENVAGKEWKTTLLTEMLSS